jgi:Domain of unknown function (DUF4387)
MCEALHVDKLGDLTKLIRSKNAGPFLLTFDILFDNWETYVRVRDSGTLSPQLFSDMYRTPVNDVQFSTYDPGMAIKVTIPRGIFSGDVGDPDIYGGQQYALLVDIEVP